MNIDSRVITVGLFLVVQAIGAVIFGAKLSSEVERLANVQAASIPPLQVEAVNCSKAIHQQSEQIERLKAFSAETSGLDVLSFKVDELRKEIAALRDEDIAQRKQMSDILSQHESIFQAMQSGQMPMQKKGGYGYN